MTEDQRKILYGALKQMAESSLILGDAESLLDVLYWNYAENNSLDNQKIKDGFAFLRGQFPHLSMQDFDPVFNTVSGLCLEHERDAFMDGIRAGVLLVAELNE